MEQDMGGTAIPVTHVVAHPILEYVMGKLYGSILRIDTTHEQPNLIHIRLGEAVRIRCFRPESGIERNRVAVPALFGWETHRQAPES